jgi:dihydrofolate synthase / folylpolyglutamate synthase
MPEAPPVGLLCRRPGRIRPDLGALRQALADLGNPERRFASILVVGTNGKGSTAAMLAGLLSAAGVRTGLYTSPHLVRVEERIRLDRDPIAPPDLERHLRSLAAFPDLTYFEALTAAAFLAFAEAEVSCAVLEAGMGGRWDATRLAASAVVGVTNIGTDHMRWLGADRSAIARDKGAAAAAARISVLGPGVDDEVLSDLGAPRAIPAARLALVAGNGDRRARVCWEGGDLEVEVPLAGAHQLANLQLAVALASAAAQAGIAPLLAPAAVRNGLALVHWPGRLSRHRVGDRAVLLDGAHNREAAQVLAAFLAQQPTRYNLLFSCLDDKPVEAMAAAIEPHVDAIAVCPLADERAMPLARLVAAFPRAATAADPAAGLERLPDPVLAAGSLRLVGALLEVARPVEPP